MQSTGYCRFHWSLEDDIVRTGRSLELSIMATHQEHASLIWQIADLLCGPYRRPHYERVMLPMTVVRRFDCVLAPRKSKVLAEHARCQDKLKGGALDAKLNRAAGDQRFHHHSGHFMKHGSS